MAFVAETFAYTHAQLGKREYFLLSFQRSAMFPEFDERLDD